MDLQADAAAGNSNNEYNNFKPRFPFTSIIVSCSNETQGAAVYGELLKRQSSGKIPAGVKLFAISDPMGCRVGSGGALFHCLQHAGSQIFWSKGSHVQMQLQDISPAPLSSVLASLSSEKILLIHSGGDARRCTTLSVCGKVWANFPVLIPHTIFDALLNTLSNLFLEVEMGDCVMACSDVFFDVAASFYEHYPKGILPFSRNSLKDIDNSILMISLPVPEDIASHHGVLWVKGCCASPLMTDVVRKVDNLVAKPSLEVLRFQNEKFHNEFNGYALVDAGIFYYPWRFVSALTSLAYEEEMHYCTSIGLNASTIDKAISIDAFSDFIPPLLFDDQMKTKEINGMIQLDSQENEKLLSDTEEREHCEKYAAKDCASEAYQRARKSMWKSLRKFSLYTFVTSQIRFCHVGSIIEFQEFVQKVAKMPENLKQVSYWDDEDSFKIQFSTFSFEARFFNIAHPLVALKKESEEDSRMCVYNSIFTYFTKTEMPPAFSVGCGDDTFLAKNPICYGQLGRHRFIGKRALVEHSNIEGPFYIGSNAFVSCIRTKGLRKRLCVFPRIVLQEVCVNTRKLDKGILTDAVGKQTSVWEYVTSLCGLSDQLKLQSDHPSATICNASWETFFLCLQCCSINLSHNNVWEDVERRHRCLWNARIFVSYRYTSPSPCSLWLQYLFLIEKRIAASSNENLPKDGNFGWVTAPKLALCQNLISEYHLEGAIRRWSISRRLSFSDLLRLSDPGCELMWRNRVLPFVIETLSSCRVHFSNFETPNNSFPEFPSFHPSVSYPNFFMTSVPYSTLLVEQVLINNSAEDLLNVCYNSGLRDKIYLVSLLYKFLQPPVIKELTRYQFLAIRCVVLIYVILESFILDMTMATVSEKHCHLMSALEGFRLCAFLNDKLIESFQLIITQIGSVTCTTLQRYHKIKKGGPLAASSMHSTLTGDDSDDEDFGTLEELASLAFLHFYICKLFIQLVACSSIPPLRKLEGSHGLALGQIVRVEAPCRADIGGGWCDSSFAHSILKNGSVTNLAINFDGNPVLGVTCKRTHSKGIRLILLQRSIKQGVVFDSEIGSTLLTNWEQLENFQPHDIFRLLKASMCTLCLLDDGGDKNKRQEILNVERVYSCFFNGSCGGLEIQSSSRLPIGSGMGSSSILISCVAQAVGVSIGLIPENKLCLVYLTFLTEQFLQTCGGWQDSIGGVYPGIKCTTESPIDLSGDSSCSSESNSTAEIMPVNSGEKTSEYKRSHGNVVGYDLKVKELPISASFLAILNSRMLFISTGSRVAQNILDKIIARWHGVCNEARELLQRINVTSELATKAILQEDIALLGSVMNEYFDLKRKYSGCAEVEDITLIREKIKPFIYGSCLCGAGFCGFLFCLTTSDEAEASIRRIVNEFSIFSLWKASISQNGITTTIEM